MTPPLKVAVVTSFPSDPARPQGGVEAVSVSLVRALSTLPDLSIEVVTVDTKCVEATITTLKSANASDVLVHRLPRSPGSTLAFVTGAGRRLINAYVAGLRADVVHSHDTYGLMVQGINAPRVFTVHGFIYGDTLVSGGRFSWLRSKLWERIEKAGWASQHHIISINPYVRERLHGIATGTIHDIDNPIDPAFFDLERQERRGVIFCAALVCPRKNQIALVDAVGLLVGRGLDVELRLAGSEEEPYASLVRRRIAALGLENRVTLLGPISTTEVQRELCSASVFALVSLEENSPMGIEEAMAVGLPVVTSNRCGMPYMVRDGESGLLVDPLNPNDIADQTARILGDADLAARMSYAGKEIAVSRFHPLRIARRTREVYCRAAKRSY